MEREYIWQFLYLHPLLGFLQPAAAITKEFVPLAQHLAGTELSQACGET
jgi:hypothetical protein